jgi:hypothetical protein
MWTEIKSAYRDSAGIAIALPLLFALPVACELIQHFIEYRIGMFAGFEAMEAVGSHPARMGFGQVKILSLILLVYWVSRWLAVQDGATLRVFGDGRSAFLFLGVLAWSVIAGLVQQFGGTLLAPYVPDPTTLLLIGLAFFLVLTAVEIYLTVWKIGAALGNGRLTIPASFRIMAGNFWWSLGYFTIMFLPLMIVHYALNAFAVGRSDAVLWPLLVLDAIEVGYLGLILATTTYVLARRATGRKGLALAPYGPTGSITPSRASVAR